MKQEKIGILKSNLTQKIVRFEFINLVRVSYYQTIK